MLAPQFSTARKPFRKSCALSCGRRHFAGIVPESAVAPDYSLITLDGGYLLPGFVDLQVNGGGGIMFNDDPSVETLATIAQAHATLGATTILPTLITDTPDVTRPRSKLWTGRSARHSLASPGCTLKARTFRLPERGPMMLR